MISFSYPKIFDQHLWKELFENFHQPNDQIILELSDIKIKISVRYAIIHLILWKGLHRFKIQASKNNLCYDKLISSDQICEVLSNVYWSIIPHLKSIAEQRELKQMLFESIFDLANFILLELGKYQKSLSLIDMFKLMNEPKVKKILDKPIDIKFDTKAIETQIKTRSKELMDLLKSKCELDFNPLLPYHDLNLLNKDQLTQLILAVGVRTDVNDSVVKYPILSSIMKGLQNPLEMVVDSLAGKKPVMYNKVSIKTSQYFGRKQHLIVAPLKYMYPGDCGTTQFIDFIVNDINYKNIIGKYIIEDDRSLTVLSKNNIKNYINKVVRLRSPIACNHTNGVCNVCGGLVLSHQTPELHVGMNSSTQMVAGAVQNILSSKHLTKTDSLIYQIPQEISHIFTSLKDISFLTKDFFKYLKTGYVGINRGDIDVLSDLKLLKDDKLFVIDRYSRINNIKFKIYQKQDNSFKEFDFPLADERNNIPYLHIEMLKYMEKHYDEMFWENDVLWIPFKNWDVGKPILGSIIMNKNMMSFVKSISNFLTDKIEFFTNGNDALREFSDLMYTQSNCNIAHLEMILRSYMITSQMDYSIPSNVDVKACLFSKTASILKKRSLSLELAFESLFAFLTNIDPYVFPMQSSIFDNHFDI